MALSTQVREHHAANPTSSPKRVTFFKTAEKAQTLKKTLIGLPNKAAISGKFCLKFHLIFGTRLALLSVLPQICPTLERSRSCNWTKKVT